MTRLKAWFVTLSGMAAMGATAHAVIELLGADARIGWIGALVANAAFLAQLTLIMLRIHARTSASLPLAVLASGSGLALAVVGAALEGASPLALGYAGFGVATTLLYVFWYSRLGREDSPALAAGARLPALTFEDADGETVTSEALLGKGPLLLMFYRGNWCPLCNAQIKELAARYRELEERGVTVAFISPQSHENTRSIAERFDVPARFLVDVEHRAAEALGIRHDGGLPAGMEVLGYEKDTVYPTVVITDAEGTILWADQTDNYRVRPEPDVFLRILDGADPAASTPDARGEPAASSA